MTKTTRRGAAVLLAMGLAVLSACGTDSQEQTLFIADTTVACSGPFPRQCLQSGPSASGPWTLFYNDIEGFKWEAGYVYELRVRVTEVPDPPADGSSLHYELIRVVAKTAVPPPR